MPSCTVAGVFGIARSTGTPSFRCFSICAVGIAAATESTVWSDEMIPPTSPSSTSKSCGLTAITMKAAPETASLFESVVVDAVALGKLVDPLLAAAGDDDLLRACASRS